MADRTYEKRFASWADKPMPSLGDLALLLGGSSDSFTGMLLALMCKADQSNRARLASAFPREDMALRAWHALSRPTYGTMALVMDAGEVPQ